jgi:hypothetical protein
MELYMEAQYVNIDFLVILNTGAIPDAYRDWKRYTPVNQTWADFRRDLLHLSGNNSLYQALPVVQDITQQMLQKIMNQLPFLVTSVLSLPWRT